MSARPIRSDELLDLARSLVPSKVPAGRPKTARLRRGASIAYYALFHEFIDLATAELCGAAPALVTRRRRASRWFAHTDLRALADSAIGRGGGVGRAIAGVLDRPHPDLISVARSFRNLQEARQQADYDHDYDLTRQSALLLIEEAADAIAKVRRLRRDGDPSLRLFLRLMVGAVKIAKSRTP
jgi:hypothetical protein